QALDYCSLGPQAPCRRPSASRRASVRPVRTSSTAALYRRHLLVTSGHAAHRLQRRSRHSLQQLNMSVEKKASNTGSGRDLEFAGTTMTTSTRLAAMFGGKGVTVGPRIAPVPDWLKVDVSSDGDEHTSEAILNRQLASEEDASIQYRTCS